MKEDDVVPSMLPVVEEEGEKKAELDACLKLDAQSMPMPMSTIAVVLYNQQRQALVAVMAPMKKEEKAMKFHALGLDEHREPVVVAVIAMMVVDKKKKPASLVATATSPMALSHCWCDCLYFHVSISLLLPLWSRPLLYHAHFIHSIVDLWRRHAVIIVGRFSQTIPKGLSGLPSKRILRCMSLN